MIVPLSWLGALRFVERNLLNGVVAKLVSLSFQVKIPEPAFLGVRFQRTRWAIGEVKQQRPRSMQRWLNLVLREWMPLLAVS
jgi:hypothetical protein